MNWREYLLYRFQESSYYFREAATASNAKFLWLTVLIYAIAGVLMAWMFTIAVGSMKRPTTPPPVEGDFPYLTVVVSCYEEELVIARNVRAITSLDYPSDRIQFLYVYDRGKDRTPELLSELQREYPIEVVENQGSARSKAAAINFALRHHARGDVIAVYDADTMPHPGNAKRAAAWLAARPELGLVNGRRRIFNARENWLTRIVSIEYHALYRVEHYGRPSLGGIALFYGSNGFFRRAALDALDGFDGRMLVEDIDIGFRLLESGYRTRYDPFIEEFDEAPPTLKAWWRQRLRWARGWIQILGRHMRLVQQRMDGFKRWSGTFMLGTVPAPLLIFPLWLMLLPYLFDGGLRAAFFKPAFWLVAWTSPIAYFMMGWFHDARHGEHRWWDLPWIVAVLPMLAYYTMRSLVMWHAFALHFLRKTPEWVKTERSHRSGNLRVTAPATVPTRTPAPTARHPVDARGARDGQRQGPEGDPFLH